MYDDKVNIIDGKVMPTNPRKGRKYRQRRRDMYKMAFTTSIYFDIEDSLFHILLGIFVLAL